MNSEIGGLNTTVAPIQAQLDSASWELSQTTIRAPADGYAPVVALTVGDRASERCRSEAVATSGTIARTGAIGGATVFPAVISIPEEMNR